MSLIRSQTVAYQLSRSLFYPPLPHPIMACHCDCATTWSTLRLRSPTVNCFCWLPFSRRLAAFKLSSIAGKLFISVRHSSFRSSFVDQLHGPPAVDAKPARTFRQPPRSRAHEIAEPLTSIALVLSILSLSTSWGSQTPMFLNHNRKV